MAAAAVATPILEQELLGLCKCGKSVPHCPWLLPANTSLSSWLFLCLVPHGDISLGFQSLNLSSATGEEDGVSKRIYSLCPHARCQWVVSAPEHGGFPWLRLLPQARDGVALSHLYLSFAQLLAFLSSYFSIAHIS